MILLMHNLKALSSKKKMVLDTKKNGNSIREEKLKIKILREIMMNIIRLFPSKKEKERKT